MSEVSGRGIARGTLMLTAAQVVALATGFLMATFLTRRLGPSEYGTYAVVLNVVTWAEVLVAAILRQATIKLLAEADEWQATIGAVVRIQAVMGLGMVALLLAFASLISKWLNDPGLAGYLRLYAFDVPLFTLSSVLSAALLGRRSFGRAGLVTCLGWGGRLVLVLVLVGSGLGVTGALLAAIGSSFVTLVASWYFVRPRLLGKSVLSRRVLWDYSLPLFLRAVSLQLFRRLDLMTVKALQGAAAAGFYGAAQTLTTIPSSRLIVSLSQVLLASLPRLLASGHVRRARTLMAHSMRLALCSVPFAGLVAGAAPEIVELIYGRSYLPAANAVALLALGAVGLAVLSVCSSILTASSRPSFSLALIGPLALLSLAGNLVLVPRLGIVGAAATIAALAWLGASASVLAVHRVSGAGVAAATLLRIALTAAFAYGLASVWPVAGVWVIGKLLVLCAGVLLSLFALGALTPADLAFARSVLGPEQANSND
jgi:O-antigen/teichoic acid export membrane protein